MAKSKLTAQEQVIFNAGLKALNSTGRQRFFLKSLTSLECVECEIPRKQASDMISKLVKDCEDQGVRYRQKSQWSAREKAEFAEWQSESVACAEVRDELKELGVKAPKLSKKAGSASRKKTSKRAPKKSFSSVAPQKRQPVKRIKPKAEPATDALSGIAATLAALQEQLAELAS